MKPKPKNIELYRLKLSCQIGRDAINGSSKLPPNTSAVEYAIFNLLHAIEDLGAYLEREGAR